MSWKTPRQFNNVQKSTGRHYYNGSASIENNQLQLKPKPTNLPITTVRRRKFNGSENSDQIKEVVWPPPPEDAELIEAFENDQSDSNSHQFPKPHHTYLIRKPTKPFSPPPTYIPLRASTPIMQSAPLVYKSQPVTNSFRGGARKRGDQKWPPPEYKEQMEAEERERMEHPRGFLHKPKKINKDCTPFFYKNTVPHTYPGYKAPPGTQHHQDESDY